MGLKVVVTGGSGGIGRETALRFSKDGHEVLITGRSEAKLEETVSLAKGTSNEMILLHSVNNKLLVSYMLCRNSQMGFISRLSTLQVTVILETSILQLA